MRKRTAKIITFFFAALFFFTLVFSFALAEDRKLEIEYPEIFGLKPETVKTFLPEYVKYIFNFSIAIFGLVVFGVLIKGGALYITSAGNPAKLQDAKEQISSAFLGIVILLLSYLILTTINPQLVMFKVPLLTKSEICKGPDECPKSLECREGKCVKFTCESDADCLKAGKGYVCDKEKKLCVMEKEEFTLISYEIPLGQMIENGIWKKEEIEKTKKLLDEFEGFLEKEKIADTNKYLKYLTDSCQCDALTGRCTKPEDWGTAIGCTGDPCKDTREEIDNILAINEEEMKELQEYKEKITGRAASSTEEVEKFLNKYEKLQECMESGEVVTRNEYLAQVEFYAKQGIKTVVIPSYIPSKGDPSTFYCSAGGTIFDMLRRSSVEMPEELTPTDMPAEEVGNFEPLSCPAAIPVGEVLDGVVFEALQNNQNLDLIIAYIDEFTVQIKNMGELVSECNEQNCDIKCSCWPNPCYRCCSPVPCGFCVPFCASPCLNTLGGGGSCFGKNLDAPYHGSACPSGREDDPEGTNSIYKTLEKIKLYEDSLFEALNETKTSFSQDPYVLETSEGSANLLNAVRAVSDTCFSENTEEPTWMMLNCAIALGNYGPDGKIITNCHPQSFFCCTADKNAATKAKKTLPREAQEPSVYSHPQAALSGDCNEDIITQAASYANITYSQGSKDKRKWRRVYGGQGHCADIVKTLGPAGVTHIDCSGLVSRVYRDLGIFPNPPSKTWCIATASIQFGRAKGLLYEVPASDIQKGDIIWQKGHVQIFVQGDVNGRYQVWEATPPHVVLQWYAKPKPGVKYKYYRRVKDCSASP